MRSGRLERLGRLSVIIPKRTAIVKLGWTTVSYGIVQVIRLLSNVILARLLAPPLFGLMLIVNTIRTGVELLSDVGINQNIVSHKEGASPDFVDTAWTLQMLRGLFLGAVFLLRQASPRTSSIAPSSVKSCQSPRSSLSLPDWRRRDDRSLKSDCW